MAPRTGSRPALRALVVTLLAIALLAGVGRETWAQERPSSDPSAALAQALFAEGRTLLGQDRYEEACAKFTESLRLVPASGTQLNLGLCHEKEGKLAAAYAELGESRSRAVAEHRPEREKLAREHLEAIEQRVARITINVTPAVAAIDGLEVKLDGAVLKRPAWGLRSPVDPGPHQIEATAPGREAFHETITVTGEGERHVVAVPLLAPSSSAPADGKPRAETPPKTAMVWQTRRWVGFAVGMAGIIITQSAVGFTIEASSDWKNAKSRCPNLTCTSRADQELGTSAGRQADYATALYIIGGAALAAGLALFITAPNIPKKTGFRIAPLATPTTAGLTVGGTL